jgi:S1-C subfamily serine protease
MKATVLLAALLCAGSASAEIPERVIERAKLCVVSVERNTTIGLNGENPGRARATGFVVDLNYGIIATNRHVTGTSPATFRVVARSGASGEARPLYYDPFSDVAFLKVSSAVLAGAAEAVFAPQGSVAEGGEVFLVGNNEGYEYSVKTGRVVNTRVHKGRRHDLAFQTSFDRTGGSSGSPVFDAKGRVAGIHASGTDTSSFELRAAYVEDALYALRAGALPKRGDPLAVLEPLLISEARRSGRLPAEAAKAAAALPGAPKRLLAVKTSAGGLRAGDIIMSVDGVEIGDDSYLFDKLMNNKAGETAVVAVYRRGRLEITEVPVADANKDKITRFATFCGAVFTPYTDGARLAYGETSSGVLLARAEKGSPFRLPTRLAAGKTLLISEFNGRPLAGLADLEAAAAAMKDGESVTFSYKDLSSADRSVRQKTVTAELKFWPLRTYEWSQAALEWETK